MLRSVRSGALLLVVLGTATAGLASTATAATPDFTITFPSTAVGALAASQDVTLVNNGVDAVTVASAATIGDDLEFGLTGDTCSGVAIPPAATCTLSIAFSPATPGTKNTRLDIAAGLSPAPGNGTAQTIALSGSGAATSWMFISAEAGNGFTDVIAAGAAPTFALANGNQSYFGANVDGQSWVVQVDEPTNIQWTVGSFAAQTTADATHGRILISIDGVLCPDPTGIVEVLGATNVGGPNTTSLGLRFEANCGGSGDIFGSININGSSASLSGVAVEQEATWSQIAAGTPVVRSVRMINAGPATAHIGQLTLEGSDATAFHVDSDPCSNQDLTAGADCTVVLSFGTAANVFTGRSARLVVPHAGALAGGQVVGLFASTIPSSTSNYGEFIALKPTRIMNTRTGLGGRLGAIGPNGKVNLQITGKGGVPGANVLAVAVDITASSTSTVGSVTLWPTGAARPAVGSMAAVPPPDTKFAVVKVGSLGRISVGTRSGSTHVVLDVVGYFVSTGATNGTRYHPLNPVRIGSTTAGGGVTKGGLGAGTVRRVSLPGKGGLPKTPRPYAVLINVMAYKSTAASGFLTVYPDATLRPATPQVTFGRDSSFSNVVVVKLPANGVIDVYNSAGTTQVAIDVLGYFYGSTGTAGRFIPTTQQRLWDTRTIGGAQGTGETFAYPIATLGGIAYDATAAMLTVTAVSPSADGFLRVYPDDLCSAPAGSDLRTISGRSGSISTIATLSATGPCSQGPGLIDIHTVGTASNVIIDAVGYFT